MKKVRSWGESTDYDPLGRYDEYQERTESTNYRKYEQFGEYLNYKQRVRKEHNWNGTGTHESNIYN